MPAKVTVEGLAELKAKIRSDVHAFEADLRGAALDAAGAGITAAQEDHPYQDHREPGKSFEWKGMIGLTDTSHAEQPRIGSQSQGFEADMVWPADYARFVNDGTSRSKPYPFTPIAVEAAKKKLDEGVAQAVANFTRNVQR